MGGNNPETQKRYYKKWREANREKYLEGKRDYYRRNRETELRNGRSARLRRAFGVSEEQYQEMLVRQNGVCAICGEVEKTKYRGTLRRLSVDHDHDTHRVRGLLCQRCNAGIGYFRDDPTALQRAIAYLTPAVPPLS